MMRVTGSEEDVDLVLARERLLDRRSRLASAVHGVDDPSLTELLQQVDAALERVEHGSFGRCSHCEGMVEPERLLADPLQQICLDCLSPSEQRELERDLHLAAEVQAALLPERDLCAAGWVCHLDYQPLGTVSGDYCDLLVDDDELLLLLGDVSGKGVSAAMLMSHLHAVFRSLAWAETPLVEMLGRANRLFCEATLAQSFATLIAARLRSGGRIELANAGHCPALVIGASEVQQIDGTGLPLGLFCSATYAIRELQLEPGETLLLYTDGLTESAGPDGIEYGTEALLRRSAGLADLGPADLARACIDDARRHRGTASATDDLTVLAVRWNG